MNVFWLLLVAGLLAFGQMLLFKRAGLRGVAVDRRFTKARVFAGESLEMIETIENRRILPVPWLRIESRISPFLRFCNLICVFFYVCHFYSPLFTRQSEYSFDFKSLTSDRTEVSM